MAEMYMHDSFAWRCTATVLACHPGCGASDHWEVQLSQTILYPESGGQPADRGTIQILSDSNQIKSLHTTRSVIDVQRRQDDILIHTVIGAILPVGSEIQVDVDADRRLDHMQQHTGQHLLSAVTWKLSGASTLGWEMHPIREDQASNGITVTVDALALSAEQLQNIQDRCNQEIRKARPVTSNIINAQQAPQVSESQLFRGVLPSADKLRKGLRVVEIASLDQNPCCGTHLSNLAQLQLLHVVGCSRSGGHSVVTFLAGGRAHSALAAGLKRESALNKVLGCGPSGHSAAVQRITDQRKNSSKSLKSISDELAAIIGCLEVAKLPPDGIAFVHRQGADLQFLGAIAAAAITARPDCMLLLTADSGFSRNHGQDLHGIFMLSGPPAIVKAACPILSSALGGTCGGKSGRIQGKASQLQNASAELLESLRRVVCNTALLPQPDH